MGLGFLVGLGVFFPLHDSQTPQEQFEDVELH